GVTLFCGLPLRCTREMLSSSRSYCSRPLSFCYSFFFTATPTTEIYTLSLHDALPISLLLNASSIDALQNKASVLAESLGRTEEADRKSTRLNSSHVSISYAVFCLKKKKNNKTSYFDHKRAHKDIWQHSYDLLLDCINP